MVQPQATNYDFIKSTASSSRYPWRRCHLRILLLSRSTGNKSRRDPSLPMTRYRLLNSLSLALKIVLNHLLPLLPPPVRHLRNDRPWIGSSSSLTLAVMSMTVLAIRHRSNVIRSTRLFFRIWRVRHYALLVSERVISYE